MKPIIKWPGGKSSEIKYIKDLIPKYDRYIEPFFGGGAVYFYLSPNKAIINDVSNTLIDFYKLIQAQDKNLYDLLVTYNNSFQNLLAICENYKDEIVKTYKMISNKLSTKEDIVHEIEYLIDIFKLEMMNIFEEPLVLNYQEFFQILIDNVSDKISRIIKMNQKKELSDTDLQNNLYTGFTSGYYMYFRKIYNDINLNRIQELSIEYKIANFYFIREFCYGSMFRYNKSGEFNIPYGGISYNKKILKNKIDNMFNQDVSNIFRNTEIYSMDFEKLLNQCKLTRNDFIFLDPPYDTDFSDYENRTFGKFDQERLACLLSKIEANFILVIKNTDFIESLYRKNFNILSFDNRYTYNVRGRNERNVEHLIITNYIK